MSPEKPNQPESAPITARERESAEAAFNTQWLAGKENILRHEEGKIHLGRSTVLNRLMAASTLDELTETSKKLLKFMRAERLFIDKNVHHALDKELALGECKTYGKAIHAFHDDIYAAKGVETPLPSHVRFEDTQDHNAQRGHG